MATMAAAKREGRRAADPKLGTATRRPFPLPATCIIYCGDNLEQLAKQPGACVDLIYIDPPFNSNRNYEVFV
jgi:DNA modification methylase